jgi:hypothetical protein
MILLVIGGAIGFLVARTKTADKVVEQTTEKAGEVVAQLKKRLGK